MTYQFLRECALQVGVEKAVLLYHISFWVYRNECDGRHRHDGRVWTYQTQKGIALYFGMWTRDKVGRMLRSLVKDEVLLKGQYNVAGYDRTNWYSVCDEVYGMHCQSSMCSSAQSMVQNRTKHSAESHAPLCSSAQPIPDRTTDRTNDETTDRKGRKPQSSNKAHTAPQKTADISIPHPETKVPSMALQNASHGATLLPYPGPAFAEAWELWLGERRARKQKAYTPTGMAAQLKRLQDMSKDEHEAIAIIHQSIAQGWQGLFPLKGGDKRGTIQFQADEFNARVDRWTAS